MKKVLFLVAVATLFFSCQKEIEPTTPAGEKFSFKASIENLATKADMNDSYGLVWAAGDQIGIGVTGWTDCQPFSLVGAGGTTTGQFTWDIGTFDSTDAYAAFFPWQAQGGSYNSAWEGVVYFKMQGSYGNGADLDNTPYTSGKMLSPLVAPVTYNSSESNYDPIAFSHAGAAVKVTINNLPAGAHSIGMTADQQIYGNYKINVSDAGTAAMTLDGDANSTLNTIWLNYEAASAERAFTFIFPVPALTAPKLSFVIYDENGIIVWQKKLKAQTSNLGRADVLEMPAIDIDPYEQFNAVSSNWAIMGNMTDNSWAQDVAVVTDGTTCIAKGLSFPAGGEFKIKHPGSWDGAWPSSNYLINNGEAGIYDIIFRDTDSAFGDSDFIAIVPSKCPYPTAEYATTHHKSAIKNAVDLGATETANCYVITAPGSYKIPCVKGNSSTSAGTRASVQLLWETCNNAASVDPNSVIAAVDYDYRDNYVYFKTPDTLKPGNALIAALDADGNIIWSWHIWIPETEIESSTYGKIYNHELMDRNLGALVAATTTNVPVESYGLHYQWGRKDPFVGAAATSGSTNATVYGTALSLSSDALTLDQAIQNPTLLGPATNWLSVTDNDLWKNDEKTQYDPCPAGYKVPGYDSGQPLCSSDYSGVLGWTDSTEGRYFTLGSPAAVFPYAGYREEDGTTIYKNGTRAAVWFSYSTSSGYAYHMNVRNASTHEAGNTAKARGCSIRCAKIEDAPVFNATERASATDLSADESANCYVVSVAESSNASKIFKFRTVKGNSFVKNTSEGESVGSASSAVVLWETWNNASTVTAKSVIDEVEYYDNYVYFKMPASLHQGNALIAVKAANGDILWSWHIWVPATSVSSIDNGIHTTAMMDRNLGALSVAVASADAKIDVTSMGMWYQWGRKDPFPGPNNIDTADTYPGFASVSGTAPSVQKVQLSLEQSIQQPTVFARGLYEGDTLSLEDWLSSPDGTLWGDNTNKSIYDPCPVGYRVPNRDTSKPLWKANMTAETGWSYNATNYWFTLGNPASVFPCAGYCNGGTAKVTFRTVIWNAHHDSSGNAYQAYNIYVYLSSGNPAFANYAHAKARGNFVRCCVE